MSLSQKLELGLSVEQKLSIEERLELRQALSLRLGQSMEHVRDETGYGSADLLDGAIRETVEAVEDEDTREGLRAMLSDEILRSEMLQSSGLLAVPTKERVEEFTVAYIHEVHRGNFTVVQGEGENARTDDFSVVKADLSFALKDPDRVQKEYDDLAAFMRQEGEKEKEGLPHADVSGAQNRMRELTSAQKVAEGGRAEIETLENALRYILTKKIPDGRPGVGEFLRDAAVLNRLDFIVSERLQKRFAARFARIRGTDTPENLKNAMLNTIGEYTLISMGVVSPDVFTLRKGEVDDKSYQMLKEDLQKNYAIDLDTLMQHYGLTSAGTFFWNRWKTLEKQPTRITDNLIREFVTQTVRADADEVLSAIGYDHLFYEAKRINAENPSKPAAKEREDGLRDLLVDSFASTQFEDKLLTMIREKWYRHLDIFYKH